MSKSLKPHATHDAGYTPRRNPWEATAGVRHWTPPERDTTPGKLAFSPDLVPLAQHPLVLAREGALETVLEAHGDRFADFTEALELTGVVPVCIALHRGAVPFGVPAALAHEAGDTALDEIWHARCARRIRGHTNAGRLPAFAAELVKSRAGLGVRRRALAATIFTSVSETLITGTLNRAPLDGRVREDVRETLREHAREEAFHHAMFGQVIGLVWTQLTGADRDQLGPLYARYITAFLGPDLRAEVDVVRGLGFEPDEARRIVAEAAEQGRARQRMREAAQATVRFLEHCGALDHDPTRVALEASGLMA